MNEGRTAFVGMFSIGMFLAPITALLIVGAALTPHR
jgi:hypothetical protein